jgi:hypothetical protein
MLEDEGNKKKKVYPECPMKSNKDTPFIILSKMD